MVAQAAINCGQYYVNHRWLGGMLTNWETVSKSIKRLKNLEQKIELGEINSLTKKERLNIERQKDKLELTLGGIKNMSGLPDAIFIIDTNKESIAVSEANNLKIPVIAICDSNSNPTGIDYPIPGNDDALRAISLYCDLVGSSILQGLESNLEQSGIDIGASENLMEENLDVINNETKELIIDDENKEEVEVAYTAEGERNIDFTPEQSLRVDILRAIDKIVVNMNELDQPFARYMKKNEYEIASMVMNLTKDNVPGFEGNRNLKPKILSVTSHYMKRLPTNNAMRASKVKSNDISKRKTVIDNIYTTDIGNPMAINISNIGNQLGIPETIISLAIEEFERKTPSNSEPKPLARAGAWLYLFARKSNYKITKQEIGKIPNLSRSALNNAIESYRNVPQS